MKPTVCATGTSAGTTNTEPDSKEKHFPVPRVVLPEPLETKIEHAEDVLATVALSNFDARVRFETRAARGNPKRALRLLGKPDRAENAIQE